MPELAFVVSRSSGEAVGCLAAALAVEVARQDAASQLCGSPPAPLADRVAVLIDPSREEPRAWPARAIVVLSGAPDRQFAELASLADPNTAVYHVNPAASARLLELGIAAKHLQIGYSDAWESRGPGGEEGLSVLGSLDGYFDWVRALDAIHGGDAVLHERSSGIEPLVAGEHLFLASADALQSEATALRADRERLGAMRTRSLEFLRASLPLAIAAGALVGSARALVAQPGISALTSTPGQPSA